MVPKFRAWDKKTKEYFHISELWNSGTNPECFNFDGWTDNFGNNGRLKDIVIEQSTGLKDANGKEIYDNDIVEVVSQYWGQLGNRYKVKFNKGAFSVKYDLLAVIRSSILVIGNIHTNPELLEAQHE